MRQFALDALDAERDLSDFWRGLARTDPLTAADLALGARATPALATSALVILDAMEPVFPGSNLYHRLATLLPERAPDVVRLAADRHPTAPWLLALSARHDPLPGVLHLRAAAAAGVLSEAARLWAEASPDVRGMAAVSAALGTLEPTLALLRARKPAGAARCAAALLEAHPTAEVLPALAALYGPDLDDFTQQIAGLMTATEARAALRTAASGLPKTRAALLGAGPPS